MIPSIPIHDTGEQWADQQDRAIARAAHTVRSPRPGRGSRRRSVAAGWSDTVLTLENTGRLFLRYGPMLTANLFAAGVVVIGALALMAVVS